MNRLSSRRAIMGAALFVLALGGSFADASAQSRTGGAPNSMHAGLGLKGYDPVAYFVDSKPVLGSDKITADHGGLTWRFVSEEHRAAFTKDPAHYSPQYGGFCSWGVAQGKLFDVDPVSGWTVSGDKLYVNFNADVLKLFKADETALIARAEQNWPKINQ